jgi:hypothetical protein
VPRFKHRTSEQTANKQVKHQQSSESTSERINKSEHTRVNYQSIKPEVNTPQCRYLSLSRSQLIFQKQTTSEQTANKQVNIK